MNDIEAERALLARIHQGDKAACAECIEAHSPGLYRLARRLTPTENDAEEVVQETFLSAFKAIDRFEGHASLSTWLYRIAHNAALMRLRRVEPESVSVDTPALDADAVTVPRQLFDWCCLPESDYDTAEARQELEGAVHALPEKLRAVFVLRELEGLSTEATAAALDLSLEVVKTRLHRARLWLRERLSGYFAERVRVEAS
ncbi:MAG: sigma-70 family RNA polymerase sigma factor [Anaerolineales bacterium]